MEITLLQKVSRTTKGGPEPSYASSDKLGLMVIIVNWEWVGVVLQAVFCWWPHAHRSGTRFCSSQRTNYFSTSSVLMGEWLPETVADSLHRQYRAHDWRNWPAQAARVFL